MDKKHWPQISPYRRRFQKFKKGIGARLICFHFLSRSHRNLIKCRCPKSWDWELSKGATIVKFRYDLTGWTACGRLTTISKNCAIFLVFCPTISEGFVFLEHQNIVFACVAKCQKYIYSGNIFLLKKSSKLGRSRFVPRVIFWIFRDDRISGKNCIPPGDL